jgi:hypothetical protein
MTRIDPVIDQALDRLVEPAAQERPDWAQVARQLERLETPPPATASRPWLGRSHTRAAVALAVAAAAVAALLVGLPRGGHVSVIDRAIAAVGNGPVVHLIEPYQDRGQTLINIANGREQTAVLEQETWIDESRALIHEISRASGAIVANDLLTPAGTYSWEAGRLLPASPRNRLSVPEALRGFASNYRDALASGDAHVDREGTLDGTAVYWLRFKQRQETNPYTNQITHYVDEVAISKDTYKPLALRTIIGGQPGELTRISLIENVSRDAANLEQPKLTPMPRGEDVVASTKISATQAAAVLGTTPVWAGNAIGALKLSGVYEQRLKTWYPSSSGIAPVYSRGLVFVYGATPGDLNKGSEFLPNGSLAIRQSINPEGSYGWQQNPPLPASPDGFMRQGRGPGYYVLRHGDVFVSIQANDKQTALAAARLLSAYGD